MSQLAEQSCEACRADAPRIEEHEARQLLSTLPGWTINIQEDTGEATPQLTKIYPFTNFREALAFGNRVGALAEEANHHPALLIEWGKVTVNWWTHKIGGLHRNDFIMAAKTDRLSGGKQ